MGRKIGYANEEEFMTLKPGARIEVQGINGSYFIVSSEPFIDEETGELSILAGRTTISYKNDITVTKEADEGKVFDVDVTDLKSFCYKLYQLDWKGKNRITPQDEADVMRSYLKIYPPEKFTTANPPDETFEEYLWKHGYEGKFWHSYEYFCENIYTHAPYIAEILYGTGHFEEYRKEMSGAKDDKEPEM